MGKADSKSLVSIGMPVYNGERFICQALDSLLVQDYENFELIISDNASTDATWQICQEYATKDPRIRLNLNEHNLGVVSNFDLVLNMARGPYFMWAAGDDFWLPAFISTLIRELEAHPEAGVAMCAIERVKEDGTLFDVIRFYGRDNPNQMTHCRMATAVITPPVKNNLFIYGLFRTGLLRQARQLFPPFVNERPLLSHIALVARFRYVDEILFKKTVREVSFKRLQPSDPFTIARKNRCFFVRVMLALTGAIVQASNIPWYRKPCLVALLFRYGKRNIGLSSRFQNAILRHSPAGVVKVLRRLKSLLTRS